MERKYLIGIMALLLLTSFLVAKNYSVITGLVTGMARVEVECLMAVSLPVSTVDFGVVTQGTVDDTSDNSPSPMIIQNDGQIKVDISISRDNSSSALFSGTGGGDNSSSFQFKADYNETNSFDWLNSSVSWTNVPGADGANAIKGLKYNDSSDSAEVDLKINVPNDEPSGEKNEALLFTASASSGAECNDEAKIDADCLIYDVSSAKTADKKLKSIKMENICNYSITITKAKVMWTVDGGEQTKKIKIEGTETWKFDCGWGCSPLGEQYSGTLLDFGSRDYVLHAKTKKDTDEMIEFDSVMDGKVFNMELTLLDNSKKSTGDFSPA